MNSQIASDGASAGGSQPGSTGVGFAISSNTVAQAIKSIQSGNGVSYASATRGQAESEGGSAGQSPYEAGTPSGPGNPYGEAEAQSAEPGTEAGSGSSGAGTFGPGGEGQELITP